MGRVTGIGGIFFKSDNPEALYKWYEEHLGIKRSSDCSGAIFEWGVSDEPDQKGMTVWSIFPRSTKYFDPSPSSFMINFRVDDLDAILAALKEEGYKRSTRKIPITDTSRGSWIPTVTGLSCGSRQKPNWHSRCGHVVCAVTRRTFA